MEINQLFDPIEYDRLVATGYISRKAHPLGGLWISNYTPKTAYENAWGPETSASRGLVTDDSGRVVSRPPAKFFNYGQPGAPSIALDEQVSVSDKLDGSLGIMYPSPDGLPAIATRGSFVSEQAIAGTAMLRTKHPEIQHDPRVTYYFEVIAPFNRIVVQYNDLNDLVLLGSVNIDSGEILDSDEAGRRLGWTGLRAEQFAFRTFGEALSAAPRKNAEGYVIRRGNDLVKIKQQDYMELHRAKFHTTPRSVHAALSLGGDRESIVAAVPDEFHDKVKEIVDDLVREFYSLYGSIAKEHSKVAHIEDQKAYAMAAKQLAHPSALFSIKAGRSIDDYVWKLVRPSGAEALAPLAN